MNKWIRRRRNSYGFGIQSPSDYNFVRYTLREKMPFYAYSELDRRRKDFSNIAPSYNKKTDHLLFRIANYVHTSPMIEVGSGSGLSACYLSAGHRQGKVITIDSANATSRTVAEQLDAFPQICYQTGDQLQLLSSALSTIPQIGLLHIAHTAYYKEAVSMALTKTDDSSIIVIEGINDNTEKKQWWDELQQNEQIQICYDAKKMGILVFDKRRYRQTYWINLTK